MIDLTSYHARICQVAGGILIHHGKVLLVHHKKLGFWLAPGGHIEAGELPHQAAEREVYEETNIKVVAINPFTSIESNMNQYVPVPIATSLHWVNKESYEGRLASAHPDQPYSTTVWPKGCEQHFGMVYLVRPVDENQVAEQYDPNESLGIGWFGLDDLDSLNTTADIRAELHLAFSLMK